MQSAPPSQAPWIRQKWAFLAGLARRMPRLFHCCTKIETSGAARRPTNQFPCISYQHANEQPITVRLHALSLAPWNLALECETGSSQTRTNQALCVSREPGSRCPFASRGPRDRPRRWSRQPINQLNLASGEPGSTHMQQNQTAPSILFEYTTAKV